MVSAFERLFGTKEALTYRRRRVFNDCSFLLDPHFAILHYPVTRQKTEKGWDGKENMTICILWIRGSCSTSASKAFCSSLSD